MPVDRDRYRQLAGSFPTGVTIVTTRSSDGAPRGLTTQSFVGLSTEPPLMLVAIDKSSRTLVILKSARSFVINFLKQGAGAILLVDTYDTIEGIRQVIRLSREMGSRFEIAGIRLDSGDPISLSREARRLLDEAGLSRVKIFASSSLDEQTIEELVESSAPIDGFGVGTRMAVSADAPYLDFVYKLVEYAGRPRTKRSPGKGILPGRKQVYRQIENSIAMKDIVTLREESSAGTPLLDVVMTGGRRVKPSPALMEIRKYCREQLRGLPKELLQLTPKHYPVEFTASLRELTE